MSVQFNKLIVASAILALVAMASGASAAPSLGIDKPYYGSNQQSGSHRGSMRGYAPARRAETRQSFSYEPAEGESATSGTCGCGSHRHAAVAPSAPQEDVATAPQVERRSFSYEPSDQPAPRARSYNRSAAPKKDAWLIPKSDPRRYSR